MPEHNETPQEYADSSKTSLWKRFKTVGSVAFNGDYDASVDPAAYEAYVTKTGGRVEHARVLSNLMERYMPAKNSDGGSARVLDVAAGTGIISRALVERGYEVAATDLSESALEYLKQQSQGVEAQQADMNEGLPYQDEEFDGATSVWANRFVADSDAFLSEVKRVLKPGGVFIWPIFPTERGIWKMRNGVRQHTTSDSLRDDAVRLGFSDAEVVKMSVREARENKIPLHSLPRYVIARK